MARDLKRRSRQSWFHSESNAFQLVSQADELILRQLSLEEVPSVLLFDMAMAFAHQARHDDELESLLECASKGYLPAQAIYGQILAARGKQVGLQLKAQVSQWAFNAVASGYLFSKPELMEGEQHYQQALQQFRDGGGYNQHYCSKAINPINATGLSATPDPDTGLVENLENALRLYPLHLAAALDQLDEDSGLTMLLERGTGIQARDQWGDTALLKCCMAGHLNALRSLVQAGADASLSNELFGFTPLHWLFMFKDRDIEEAAALLQQAGANFGGVCNVAGFKAFHFPFAWPSGAPLHWAVFANSRTALRALIARGADMNSMDVAYQTPLHVALKMRNASMVKLLLDLGASLNTYVQNPRDGDSSSISDDEGNFTVKFEDECRTFISRRTPVHDFLWCEVALGGDPSFEEFDDIELGRPTEYDLAIFTDNNILESTRATLELLVQHDTSCLAWQDANNFTPLHCAAFSAVDASVIELLLHYTTVEAMDIKESQISFICQLLRHKSDAFGGDEGLASFIERHLNKLSRQERSRILNIKEAKDGEYQSNPQQQMPLHYAAKLGFPLCTKTLLELGGDPAATTIQGLTPLQLVRSILDRDMSLQKMPRMFNTDGCGSYIPFIRFWVVLGSYKHLMTDKVQNVTHSGMTIFRNSFGKVDFQGVRSVSKSWKIVKVKTLHESMKHKGSVLLSMHKHLVLCDDDLSI